MVKNAGSDPPNEEDGSPTDNGPPADGGPPKDDAWKDSGGGDNDNSGLPPRKQTRIAKDLSSSKNAGG